MAYQCYDENELGNLRQVIESQGPWRGSGHENFTGRFERDFGERLGSGASPSLRTSTPER